MKILELRFKNLNSLYGEWVIDFTDPEYTSNGLFTLTGPTGAGKSTILDAICLALYGTTPRLNRINKSENEIMSRQTGECYSEVLFESQEGRFRCHWEQRKARKKIDGKLQDQEHQIIDAVTEKPIEIKKSLIPKIVEEKTGMDFERFTRSVLLAQGGFDSFLKADDDQKSKILEQLTGSGIYSDISIMVHERQRKEQNKLQILQSEVSGIVILTEEEEKEIQQNLSEQEASEQTEKTKYTDVNKALTWINRVDELQGEIIKLASEEIRINSELESFKPQREKLSLSRKASSLEVSYTSLNSLRKQQLTELASQKEIVERLPKLKTSAEKQIGLLKEEEERTKLAKLQKEQASELIKKVRSIDQRILDQTKIILEKDKSCKDIAENIKRNIDLIEKETKKNEENNQKLELIDKYLSDNEEDSWLIANMTGIEEQLKTIKSQKEESDKQEGKIIKLDAELCEEVKTLAKYVTEEKEQNKKINEVKKKSKQENESLSDLLKESSLREYRNEEKSLLRELSLLKKIESLEDERNALIAGEPCPLCGAKEHPYTTDNPPEIDSTQQRIDFLAKLIEDAEKKEELIKKYEYSVRELTDRLNEIEKAKSKAENKQQTIETSLKNLRTDLANLLSNYSDLQLTVLSKLQPLGIAQNTPFDNEKLIVSLKERLKKWNYKLKEKSKIERQITDNIGEIKSLNAVVKSQKEDLLRNQVDLNKLSEVNKRVKEERIELYGDKNSDEEENKLQKAIEESEKSEKKIREKSVELQKELATEEKQLESLEKSMQLRLIELNDSENNFVKNLNGKGFAEEKYFLQSLLSHDEIDLLSKQAKQLDDSMIELKTRLTDRNKSWEEEKSKNITDKSKEVLEAQVKDSSLIMEKISEQITELKNKLRDNSKAREKIKEKQSSIDAQKKECQRWDKLHSLIGSADGKKYRNFAQGLTFELMVRHANRQLREMNDRYLLIRNNDNPLELDVVDNYQAGEIRSTKNLSGGESFIISLSLALGLSKMASKKVRVDSLFLDEGFGTLDEDALQTALDSLSKLQQDGKLIGIISHVTALKDKISTQISIVPVSGGRSEITGPGCRKEIKN